MSYSDIILVECPRDAIQGLPDFIPTNKKADHINHIIESDLFDWIDFGSLVSPKAVPQMADTIQVIDAIEKDEKTKLLVIVVNQRGVKTGLELEKIDYFGFPFSVSETFQMRNVHATTEESFDRVKEMADLVHDSGKELVVYLSMGFGNPYGDPWSEQLVVDWIGKIKELGVKEFSLADTTSEAGPKEIRKLFETCFKAFDPEEIRIGSHFHSKKAGSMRKIKAAYEAGCRKFDGAILGFGGCPFAEDELVGNIPSEDLLHFFKRGDYQQIFELQQSFKSLI